MGSKSKVLNPLGNALEHVQYIPKWQRHFSEKSTDHDDQHRFDGRKKKEVLPRITLVSRSKQKDAGHKDPLSQDGRDTTTPANI